MNTITQGVTAPQDALSPETLPSIAWENAKVITTELLARLSGTEPIRIQQNHARNQDRFVEGKHFHKISGKDIKDLRLSLSESQISNKVRVLILWTERGAARHAKMLDTDAAWEVFEKLEDCYFNQKAATSEEKLDVHVTLTKEEQEYIKNYINQEAQRLSPNTKQQAKFIVKAWSKLKGSFHVVYKEIPREKFTDALSILARHVVEWELVGDDSPKPGTLNETIDMLVKQVEAPNGAPVTLFMPLVNAVLHKQGFNLGLQTMDSSTLMPAPQAKEITDRLNRLGKIFHPFSEQFLDVLGIGRALRGLHPAHGMRNLNFRQVLEHNA